MVTKFGIGDNVRDRYVASCLTAYTDTECDYFVCNIGPLRNLHFVKSASNVKFLILFVFKFTTVAITSIKSKLEKLNQEALVDGSHL